MKSNRRGGPHIWIQSLVDFGRDYSNLGQVLANGGFLKDKGNDIPNKEKHWNNMQENKKMVEDEQGACGLNKIIP